jgi:hypothetical protein
MNKLLLPAILLIAVTSCKKSEATTGSRDEETYSQITKAQWLLGRWENNSAEGNMSETWTSENDSVMIGSAFVVAANDTVFAESMTLEQQKGQLTFIVSVPGQNDEKPVAFGLTKSSDDQLVFENPKHDFPNKIIYRKFGNDSLVAEISGIRDGKKASEQFPMKKASQNTSSSVR